MTRTPTLPRRDRFVPGNPVGEACDAVLLASSGQACKGVGSGEHPLYGAAAKVLRTL